MSAAFTWCVLFHWLWIPKHLCAAQTVICSICLIWFFVHALILPKHVRVGMTLRDFDAKTIWQGSAWLVPAEKPGFGSLTYFNVCFRFLGPGVSIVPSMLM